MVDGLAPPRHRSEGAPAPPPIPSRGEFTSTFSWECRSPRRGWPPCDRIPHPCPPPYSPLLPSAARRVARTADSPLVPVGAAPVMAEQTRFVRAFHRAIRV